MARPNWRDEGSAEEDEKVADLQFRERCEWAVGHSLPRQEVLLVASRLGHVWEPIGSLASSQGDATNVTAGTVALVVRAVLSERHAQPESQVVLATDGERRPRAV